MYLSRLGYVLAVAMVFSGCTTNSVLVSDRGLAPAPREHRTQAKIFTVSLASLSGNTLFIDRKTFKESLNRALQLSRAQLGFNPLVQLRVRFDQKVLDENRFIAKGRYERQYRLDRRVRVEVFYSLDGKSSYSNQFTYNVLLKSGSYTSFDDADRKAHKLLFNQLGKMVAQRVLSLRHKFQ